METLFNLTLPIFAVIALGYFAERRGMLPANAVRSINVFVFYFATPALVGGALARQDFKQLIEVKFLAGWLCAALIVYVMAAGLARLLNGADLREAALTGQAASVGNLGFLAIPLMLAAFGESSTGAIASALIVDLVILIPLSIALIEAGKSTGSAASSFARAIKGAAFNPFVFTIVLGLLLSLTGIGLPGPSRPFVEFLGGAAAPTALFSLGASLAGRRVEGDAAAVGLMSILKLAVHPIVAFLVLTALDVSPQMIVFGVVMAAMPIAGNVFVIAEQYGVMVRRSSAAILISTLAAVVTVAIALNWAGA